MKTTIAAVVALSGACAATALASPVFVGHIRFQDSYGSTDGGEFRSVPSADFTLVPSATGTAFQGGVAAGAPLFEAFCLEKFDTLEFNTEYRADLNTETTSQSAAYAGGAHGGFNDPLDPRTAYLYFHFINKNLVTAYDYANEANRINDANSLQAAIWFIEQEDATPLTGKALDFFNEADTAVNTGKWAGLGPVGILNIYTSSARAARQDFQDVLVMTSVPLPTAAGMSSVTVLGLLVRTQVRRRR